MGLRFIAVFLLVYIVCSLVYEFIFGVKQKESFSKYSQFSGKTKINKKKRNIKVRIDMQYILAIILGIIIAIITKNSLFFLVVNIVIIAFNRYIKMYNKKRRREIFIVQFKDFLVSLSSSLKSGNSIENSIIKSKSDLERIHKTNHMMINEVSQMCSEMSFGYDLKKIFTQFKKRNAIDEVVMFVNSVLIVEEKGGNTTEVITIVSKTIVDKIEIKQQIEKLTAAKKLEANLLSVLPALIAVVMFFASPSYFKPMTDTFIGKLLVVLALVMIVFNHFISKKIVEIDI